MNEYGYIYRTINLKNHKFYIGKHLGCFDPRYLGSGKVLKMAVSKYGCKNFRVEKLEYAYDKIQLNDLEKFYIKKAKKNCDKDIIYNIVSGGEGGWEYVNQNGLNSRLGMKHSEVAIAKMKEKRKNLVYTEEVRLAIRRGHWSKKDPEKQRRHAKYAGQCSKNISEENKKIRSDKLRKAILKYKPHLFRKPVDQNTGRVWMRNLQDNRTRMVLQKEVDLYKNSGYVVGRGFLR